MQRRPFLFFRDRSNTLKKVSFIYLFIFLEIAQNYGNNRVHFGSEFTLLRLDKLKANFGQTFACFLTNLLRAFGAIPCHIIHQ